MRISINLATHPFVELRPLFAKLRLAMAALAVLAIGLAVGLHFLSVRAHGAEQGMNALKAQTLAVQTERQTNERRMQQSQNRAVLDRSKFLNALFAKKSFSWTSVMMDLERVLPAGVEVTSIEPAITVEGDVNIRLRVSGDRDRAVDLVRNLEQSQRFLQPRLANETAQTQEGKATVAAAATVPGGVEFDILSEYNPLPSPAKGAPAKPKEPPQKAGPVTGKSATPGPHKATGSKAGTTKSLGPIGPRKPLPPVPAGNRKGGAQ
jgi:type IV pilus assembly protein PilN